MKLSSKFQEAITYAIELHAQQTRKGTDVPYIAHLMSVCALVLENGGAEEEAIAALLHDAIEDHADKNSHQYILSNFGDRVLHIVEGCTEKQRIPKPPWKERKVAYIEQITNASKSVLLVAMADKLHNARCILIDYEEVGEKIWDRFNGGKDGSLWYYRTLADNFLKAEEGPKLLAIEFDKVIKELEQKPKDEID
ncbi:HD domain-containing protein [Candidatus Micrarchaeota archaeon]|nr:HD domain-containing protein [Candidatus Micrarchaeota archaeon]